MAQHEFIDLHMHSTASDGSRAPADVARAAKAAALSAFALTDHDTISGLPEARAACEHLQLRLVPGVELSAVEGDVVVDTAMPVDAAVPDGASAGSQE